MTVLIQLTIAQPDTGPFDLYSNLDGYVTPFAVNISKATLQVGYTSTVVPDYTTTVRVQSKGNCVNHVDIILSTLYYPYTLNTGNSCANACTGTSSSVFNL